MAGVDWYDSGIGFAVPLEHVYATIDKLKRGEDLHGGLGPYDAAARSRALASGTGAHGSPAAGLLILVALMGCAAWLRRRLA